MDALDEHRWEAVQARSAQADGLFFYAVTTTGIFCRPSCPARRPRRENVEFFTTAAEAGTAGYRACRRCHPLRAATASPAVAAVVEVCRLLEEPGADPDLRDLASGLGWSVRHLRRVFTELTGVTIAGYARSQRAERVRRALRAGAPVTDAVFAAGYGSVRGFYEHDATRLGSSPSSYRQGSAAVTIVHTLVDTALGRVLVAASGRGVCNLRIGDSDAELLAGLTAEFPRATHVVATGQLDEITTIVVELAAGRAAATHAIPLDVRGTAFQVLVWETLRTLAPGDALSYGELARRVGRPTAARAVAAACAANPVALLVPCHRVVRGDRAAGGYRWGAPRKVALLAAEAAGVRDGSPAR